jgi:hypothetical protein
MISHERPGTLGTPAGQGKGFCERGIEEFVNDNLMLHLQQKVVAGENS